MMFYFDVFELLHGTCNRQLQLLVVLILWIPEGLGLPRFKVDLVELLSRALLILIILRYQCRLQIILLLLSTGY